LAAEGFTILNTFTSNQSKRYGVEQLGGNQPPMMKRRLLVTFAITAIAAFAQGRGPGPMQGGASTPEGRIEMRVNFLANALSLTEDQKARATTIFTQAYTASATVRTSMETARQSLEDAVKKNATSAIESAAATLGTLNGQWIAIDSKADAAFYALLTADQKAKFDSLPRRGGPMGGGFEGRGRGAGRQPNQ
jgi:Spy/CpxP family protein refolding chaperone